MKKSRKEIVTYNPNKQVAVRVTNTPVLEDDTLVDYLQTVTIKVSVGHAKEKLEFPDEDAIASFIDSIDIEDPQEALDLED